MKVRILSERRSSAGHKDDTATRDSTIIFHSIETEFFIAVSLHFLQLRERLINRINVSSFKYIFL